MWFRPRSQHNESERIRNSTRSKKTATAKCTDTNIKETNTAITASSHTLPSQLSRQHSQNCDDDNSTKEKSKALRGDQKYKKNRVSKSSSRTKVHDLKPEKPCKSPIGSGQRKSSIQLADAAISPKKPARKNTTLNLNALLRYKSFISGSTKKLTPDDFERIRRKSLGDTTAIRRKSNPDSNKKKTSDSKKSAKKEPVTYESSNDDFQSCDEQDQVDGVSMRPMTWHPSILKTPKSSKKSRTKNDKKGFYFVQICWCNLNEFIHLFFPLNQITQFFIQIK